MLVTPWRLLNTDLWMEYPEATCELLVCNRGLLKGRANVVKQLLLITRHKELALAAGCIKPSASMTVDFVSWYLKTRFSVESVDNYIMISRILSTSSESIVKLIVPWLQSVGEEIIKKLSVVMFEGEYLRSKFKWPVLILPLINSTKSCGRALSGMYYKKSHGRNLHIIAESLIRQYPGAIKYIDSSKSLFYQNRDINMWIAENSNFDNMWGYIRGLLEGHRHNKTITLSMAFLVDRLVEEKPGGMFMYSNAQYIEKLIWKISKCMMTIGYRWNRTHEYNVNPQLWMKRMKETKEKLRGLLTQI